MRPTVLLVPGAWHKPEHLSLLVDELSDFDVRTVALTAAGDDPAALGDMYSDAAAIAAAVSAIDGPVVVVAHSYGGIPATQALAGADNVVRIIYLASFQLDSGESLLASVGGEPAPWWRIHEQDGLGDCIEPMTPVEIFYGDVDPDVAARAAAQLWKYQSLASKKQVLTEVAWKTVPSTYIIAESDNAIPVFAQEQWSKHAHKVVRINASHSPFLSQPAELAQLIRDEIVSA
jgi:pimeloyl-ACP methyl ester carboxylesterase